MAATKKKPVSVAYLHARLKIDPLTGLMEWREQENTHPSWNARMAGKPALRTRHSQGYLCGTIDNGLYLAHRVAFAMYHGHWPSGVDHDNGDKTDNRELNLIDATQRVNNRNKTRDSRNKTGVAGVTKIAATGRFRAQIEGTHVGVFGTAEEAGAAYEEAKARLGYSARHGQTA